MFCFSLFGNNFLYEFKGIGIQTHFIFFLALVKKGFMFILKKKSNCLYQPSLSVDLTFTCSIMFVMAYPRVV